MRQEALNCAIAVCFAAGAAIVASLMCMLSAMYMLTSFCAMLCGYAVCNVTSLPPVPTNSSGWSIDCASTTIGSTCTAVCQSGYAGSPTATCGTNGTFLPTVTGNCTKLPGAGGAVLFHKPDSRHCALVLSLLHRHQCTAHTQGAQYNCSSLAWFI